MDTRDDSIASGQRNSFRLILFPLPFQGHINPMIQLAKILQSRGFTISIFHTRFNFPDPSKYPDFTFHMISDNLSESLVSKPDPILIVKNLNTNCVESFRECLVKLLSDDDYSVTCIMTDAMWYFTQALAEDFKIPRIVLRTSNVCSFLVFCAFSVLHEKGYLSNMESKMDEPVHDLPPLKVMDLPTIETQNPDDVYEVLSNMLNETKKSSGLIFNTFKDLEEHDIAKLQKQFPIPIFPVGPFHKSFSAASSSLLTQDINSISWLDKQAPKSVLYVSFGSLASMDVGKVHEVAYSLANSKLPFLWVVRPGLVQGSDWLEILPNGFLEMVGEKGYIVKWAPQQEVLSHFAIGGFWTHCGWNSTLESICEGVPMICSPFFGDQMVNSRYVNDVWRIGIKLEKVFDRGEIEIAIRKVMVEREGEEMRRRVMCLKEKVDLCLSSGGFSKQSLDHLVLLISSFGSFPV